MGNVNHRPSAIVLGLCAASAAACIATETDNPVADPPGPVVTPSPEQFGEPPAVPPGCPQPQRETLPNLPSSLPRSVLVSTARGPVLAVAGNGGLRLLDVTDSEQPVTLSAGILPNGIHQLLAAGEGRLWVAAVEAPEVTGNVSPSAAALEGRLRVIELDVSDPEQPVRVAAADLDGEFWELRQRGDELWVLTARHVPEQRACDAPQNTPGSCFWPAYEAITLRGFRANGGSFEPLQSAELPFDRRAFWGSEGVAAIADERTLHVLAWNADGALRPPLTFELPDAGAVAGPVEIAAGRLLVVSSVADSAALIVYDLDTVASLQRFELGARRSAIGGYSTFSNGYLWLQPSQGSGEADPAQVWDLGADAPTRVELPASYQTILPIAGARREPASQETLAIGWARDPNTAADTAHLLSFANGAVSVLAPAPANESLLYSGIGQGFAAPPGVAGSGEAPAWELRIRGLGMPLGIDPTDPVRARRQVRAFVGVGSGVAGASPIEAALIETEIFPAGPNEVQPHPVLELARGSTLTSFELSAGATDLVPMGTAVVAVATRETILQCAQSGRDCSGYAPGVAVFEAANEPQSLAVLPFPALPLPATEPNRMSMTWRIYDAFSQQERAALPLDEQRLGFVAEVSLSCDTQETCAALAIEALPSAEAGVAFGGVELCPSSDIDPDCVPRPAPVPTVYGEGLRQYFYVLDLAAAGGPAWQAWGVSTVESSSASSGRASRFAAPIASDGVLAATRLERHDASGAWLPPGVARFMLDRFERPATGEPVARAPVHVPGYPLARLGSGTEGERWIAAEPAATAAGPAALHRFDIRADGARIERTLELEGGKFAGLRVLEIGESRLGLALASPDNFCGTTRVSAIRLGTSTGGAEEPLELAGAFELPGNVWRLAAADGDYALLSNGYVHVLVQLAPDGTPRIADTRSSDVYIEQPQLLGTHLFGSAGFAGGRHLEFSPAP